MKRNVFKTLLNSLIILQYLRPGPKQELFHRGKMLTFKVPGAETSLGLSYDEYLEELEDANLLDSNIDPIEEKDL